jgi:signal transduction histidine kinase
VLVDLEVGVERAGGRVEVGDLPVIDADPMQMRQLLQNLIGNALKFHEPGSTPLIKVYSDIATQEKQRTTGHLSSVLMCSIMVEDNGIGFDEKYLDRIFAPFQRLHGRGEYEGAGIGLAVCRKIAERHGGSITARSAPGEGARFIVTLPVQQREERAA